MRTILNLAFLLFLSQALAQNSELAIGSWRAHVPLSKAYSVTAGNDVVYCASDAAILAYHVKNQEIERLSTITGLSDVAIEIIKYNKYTGSLLVAYSNGNLDIVRGGKVTNISFIKDANIIADKGIYNIRIDKELAYLSCGFGIVVLNMAREEIKDTYMIGKDSEPLRVNDVLVSDGRNEIIAGTVAGVMKASLSDNLSDYNSWSRDTVLPAETILHVDSFAGEFLYVVNTPTFDSNYVLAEKSGSVRIVEELKRLGIRQLEVSGNKLLVTWYYSAGEFDENYDQTFFFYEVAPGEGMEPSQMTYYLNAYYIADRRYGFIRNYDWGDLSILTPNGPNTTSINNIDIKNGVLWGSAGLLDPDYRFANNLPEFNRYGNLEWTGFDGADDATVTNTSGFIKTKIDPNDADHVFSASWNSGLLEIRDGKPYIVYNDTNRLQTGHSLPSIINTVPPITRVGGLDYDEDGNLWIASSEVSDYLSVRTPDGKWQSFSTDKRVDEYTIVGELIVDNNGYKWILLNRNKEIIVYDDGGTPETPSDDKTILLSGQENYGNIPGDRVNCIAQDLGGNIWIGTNQGPAVYYNPSSIFDRRSDFQRVLIEQDGQTQVLLETENIKTIAIDGANRKWLGSTNSGAYLMSSDGTKQINHFTVLNSPLFSDNISDIEINQENGEVFFCTDAGLISYKGTATEGGESFGDVQVFPNPVPENYAGLVAIKGLAENANVKITDINGNLVYETRANGGQATWNGSTMSGGRVGRGVYLVFANDISGEYHHVTKFLYLRN